MLNEKERVGKKSGFEGQWLTENYGDWRHVSITAEGDSLHIDMGEDRLPATGTYSGDEATVDFSDDATFVARLVEEGGVIKWSNGTEWIRRENYEKRKNLAEEILAMESFYDDRIDAGEKLRRLGPEKAVEVLTKFLENKTKNNRLIALESLYDASSMLGEDRYGSVIDIFRDLLDDDDPEIREASAGYLVEVFNDRMAGSLWEGVFHPLTLDIKWGGEKRGQKLLTISLAILNANHRNDRRKTAKWLKDHLREIAPVEALEEIRETLSEKLQVENNFGVREQLEETLEEVEELIDDVTRKARESFKKILRKGEDESYHDKIIDTVDELLEKDEIWTLRLLIQEWVWWIASDDPSTGLLVEYASNKMRGNTKVVELLVNQLDQKLKPYRELLIGKGSEDPSTSKDKKIELLVSEELKSSLDVNPYHKIVKRMTDMRAGILSSQRLKTRLSSGLGTGASDKKSIFGYLKNPKSDAEIVRWFIVDELEVMQLRVHRRIARQLAEMSNPDLFEDGDGNCRDVQKEMKRYAVPILAKRLPEEADPEIREDLAKVLGNVGGRESVDALARAVVGEERTRARRQELLARYYLDPSKQRSEQAQKILEDAVREAKKTLWLLQGLNAVVFFVGILILLGGLYVSFTQEGQRVAGALVGLGGLAGVVTLLINDPLNRIQNSMANLVQLETAFTSFIWELNLNGTYIQSQYVAEGVLWDSDVSQTVKRIQDAMNLTMNQVAIYTEEGRKLLVPHLTHLSTSIQENNKYISAYGKYLEKTGLEKKNATDHITILINHQPVQVEKLSRDKDEVRFELPSKLPAKVTNGDAIWVSLAIGGVETNALPLPLHSNSHIGDRNISGTE
ncbi:MAG: HEAT repeat domain-containing protein [Anaerolineales bacterium]|jgi:hypothetical protein